MFVYVEGIQIVQIIFLINSYICLAHGKEFCDKLVGKKLCLKITEICEGKMAFHVTSPDCPELSHFMVCCLGQEQCSNFPILGIV